MREVEPMQRKEALLWLAGLAVGGAGMLARPPAPALHVPLDSLGRPPAMPPSAFVQMDALRMHSLPGRPEWETRRGQAAAIATDAAGSASLFARFSPMNSYIPPPMMVRPRLGSDAPETAGVFGFELHTDPLQAFVVEQPSLGWLADDVLGRESSGRSGAAGSSRAAPTLPGREGDSFGGAWPVTGGL
jgi:hypothetical protein